MASYNRVILVGNLTRDPELRYIQSGTAVTDVGLAVNDRRKTATGEWVDEVTFVDMTVWGRQAETVSEYLTKGSSGAVRRAIEARYVGERRPEALQAQGHLRADAIARWTRPRRRWR